MLVDCPGSIYHKLLKLNLPPPTISCIFITHTHPDHIYGLPALIHSLKPSGVFPDIYLPRGSGDKISDILKNFNLEGTATIIEVDSFLPGPEVEIFPTRHTKLSRGLIIKDRKKKIIYTSDTGPLNESNKIFKNADCLIHDCSAPLKWAGDFPGLDLTHTSAETLAAKAEEAGVKMLVPVHFSGEVDFTGRDIRKSLQKFYSGSIFIPSDFSCLKI